jgi:hypothetical protein
MTSAAITCKLFGIPMQRRSTRRKLVVVSYIGLGLICAIAAWFTKVNPSAFTYAIWAAMLIGIFVFGGQGRFGLVKPFLNKPPQSGGRDPIDRIVFPDPVLLRLDPPPPVRQNDALWWKNDERELSRRDRAHYVAYQPLAVAMVLILLLLSWIQLKHRPAWITADTLVSLTYVISLFASVAAITLPAAIILWNEPDLSE